MKRSRLLSAWALVLLAVCLTGLACAQPAGTGAPPAATAASSPLPPGWPAGTVLVANVAYGDVDPASQNLAAATPAGAGPFPGLIMIHGGGWEGGDKTGYGWVFPTFLAQGIVCFSLNYRMVGVASYPAAVDDCVAAVRWIRAHAAQFHLDPDRLAVTGGSAGGHLSLMVATAKPLPTDLDAQGQPLKSLVVAVASLSGPTDLRIVSDPAYTNAVGRNLIAKFLGGAGQPDLAAKAAEASPISHVTADMPPTLLVYGTADDLVPPSQATSMGDKLKATGVPVTLLPIADRGHEVAGMAILPQVVDFLVRYLVPPPATPPAPPAG